MLRIRPIVVAASLVVILAVAGCSESTWVDGFKLGAEIVCSGPVGVDEQTSDRGCAGDLDRARAALDAREPGHAAVVSVEMFSDGTQPGPIDVSGDTSPPTPSPRDPGPVVTVFVFSLADGTRRATGVACEDVEPAVCVGVGSYPTPDASPLSATVGPQAVVLLTAGEGGIGCPLNVVEGQLVFDAAAGSAIIDVGMRKPIRWPFGYTGRRKGIEVEILDQTGTVVARSGTRIRLGGGETVPGIWFACAGPRVIE